MTNRNYFIGFIVLAITALIYLSSCMPEDNHGFPKKVEFPYFGSSKVVKGDGINNLFSITVYDENDLNNYKAIYPLDLDSLTYEWLTFRRGTSTYKEMELTAAPNETNKDRAMELHLDFGSSTGRIRVTQKGR